MKNKNTIGKAISAAIGIALLTAAVVMSIHGDGDRSDQLIGVALLVLGAVGTMTSPRLREGRPSPRAPDGPSARPASQEPDSDTGSTT